ncbi:hypothetical protein ACQ4PT_004828 [Festuca glaucescens]
MDGLVEEVNGDDLVVNCTSGKKVTVNASSAYPKDTESPRGGVEDMTRLAYLHEPGVLQNLKSRFMLNEIYTYTGNILIAVNPFQRLPHLYNNDMMRIYKGAEFGELSPHPYAITDRAYRLMINDRISQAILVSGESGAGKTESTKSLMQYLAFMGGKPKAEGRSVQEQILESNPVLEAFGNAKTVRNNNSSRFGKFVEIQFDQNGKISGAAIRTYLLERSRVCQISDPERNYHCFYMLCAAPPEVREKYKLGEARSFHYLNQSNCIELNGMDDAKEYAETRRAMSIVGINSDEQDAIFKVVAAILHLGNVEFGEGKEEDSSAPKDEKSQFHLKTAAELFMLVNTINNIIGQDPESKILIGVLDIYGFESFKTNSHDEITASKMLLEKANLVGYQIGKTKVFLRAGQMAELDALRTEAAKETGALQAAKSKLEKEVEELTWRLQLEKRIRSDMEEAKTQEIKKLQLQLQESQQQVKDTKEFLKKEQEIAKAASEKAALVPEIRVDATLVNELTADNEKLKNLANGSLPGDEQVFRASSITVDMDLVRQVEGKYPAFLFKQQLSAFVEGLYGMIRDNVKREVSSVLSLVIQAPRTAKAGLITDQDSYWQAIVKHLNDLLKTLQENCVPAIFARKIFIQIFAFINAQLFNSLLVRRECCSFSNGEYVKQGLEELEAWCTQAKPEYAGTAWDELKHISQSVGFLVIFKKFRISYDEIISDLCPMLSVQQLYRISTQYWDDKYNTESVSEEVLNEMKILVNDASGQANSGNTYLLDEETSMPLSLEEIASSMDAKEFQNVVPPQELLENAAFQFLKS